MSNPASNKNIRPQRPMWLREKLSNGQAFVQQGHKATATKVIKKNVSNDHAGIQQEHKAITTNVIKNKSFNEQAYI